MSDIQVRERIDAAALLSDPIAAGRPAVDLRDVPAAKRPSADLTQVKPGE